MHYFSFFHDSSSSLEILHPLLPEKDILNHVAGLVTHVAALVGMMVIVTCLNGKDMMEKKEPFRFEAGGERMACKI